MNVLIACEESQEVCKAFRELGHNAYSCDLQYPSGGHPEWHVMSDARSISKRVSHGEDYPEPSIWFSTSDGKFHEVDHWDLLIAHPPCTYLTAASAVRLFNKDHTIKDMRRYHAGEAAAKFFMSFCEADADRIAIENPVPLKCFDLPPYSQIIEPYMFGDPWRKKNMPVAAGPAEAAPDKCC